MLPQLEQHNKLHQLNSVFSKSCVVYPQRSLDGGMTLAVMAILLINFGSTVI